MFYGLDVHKEFLQVCALSADGRTRRDFRVGGRLEAVEAFAQSLERTDEVVLEATFHSWALVQILRRHVDRVVVAEPAQLKAIANARIKTDKVDAHILAQLLRVDFLPEVELPTADTWTLRQLMTHRRQLRRQSVTTKNTIHALLNRSLRHYPGKTLFSEAGYRWLAELELPPAERRIIDDQAAFLRQVTERLAALDRELVEQARLHPDAKLLVTIPGVDVVVAMGFLAAIDAIDRFPSPTKLASYFGLVPKVRQSVGPPRYGHITKAGSRNARWLAIEAAHTIARSSSPLAATYHRVRRRKGHQVAVTALARKLVVVVWHILTTQQPYRYATPVRTREKLRRLQRYERPTARRAPRTLDDVYDEAGLALTPPSSGEKRAAKRSRAAITRERKAKCLDS
ncbi:MAG: IS110 family RNA-guided transposase [Planctomycetota bacterium]|jgi:transposase